MRRITSAVLCASLATGCGPEAAAEPEAPGVLEYHHPYIRLYRLGRRIDAFVVLAVEDPEHHECGMLSERAYNELEDTLSALDPDVDYGRDPVGSHCPPGAWVELEGFEHSPFACDFMCCRPELARVALIYFLISSYFGGYDRPFEIDGEPYVVIEPDEPCPPLEERGS